MEKEGNREEEIGKCELKRRNWDVAGGLLDPGDSAENGNRGRWRPVAGGDRIPRMASVRPFRALRPRPDLASQVAAVPYDVVSTEEARALAAGHPLSFLHVSRAEIDLPPDTNPYADLVYQTAVANFDRLRASMEVEAEPAMYFYRLRMGQHEQTGLAACYSVDEYNRDIVKKHEKTRKEKEDDRTRHIVDLRAQTGPVFLTYKHQGPIDALAIRVCAGPPLYDFTAPDGVAHTVWKIDPVSAKTIVHEFGKLPALYIADGHHRAASAARAHDRFGRGEADAEHAWFLAVAFPDDQTQILPYNRLVKDLHGHTPAGVLTAIRERFAVREGGPASPAAKGECAMYLAGAWYTIALAGGAASADPIGSLDVSILQERVLAPVFGIEDPRTDKRIDFVGGIRGTGELVAAVDAGRAAVAFSMFPVTVAELMAIADAGGIMPPKSTWFEPKLRDGLLSHLI